MTYEELFNKAMELFNNGDKEEAGELFEQVARATGDEAAMGNAIRAYYICAIADKAMAVQGMFHEEYSLESVDKAISLIEYGVEKEIIDFNEFGNDFGECCEIKGYILYRLKKAECMEWLDKAEKLGINQARKGKIFRLLDMTEGLIEGSPELERIKSDICELGEEYIRYYNPEDADGNELLAICKALGAFFSGVDNEKAGKYSNMANNYNPQTRTIMEPAPKPEKKKGFFGFGR